MSSNRFNSYSDLGIGIGLRSVHLPRIVETLPSVDWFEVISEAYMVEGGRPLAWLDQVASHYPIVQHGVSLYPGSAQGLDEAYLQRLKELTRRTKTPWVSDHLCWGSIDGTVSHDLLPLPYTKEAVRCTVANIRRAQDILELPFVVENLSSYAEFHASTMSEWQFLCEVVEGADAGILLDVNNIYVSSANHGFDPYLYLEQLPHERVAQIHVAGHSRSGKVIIDTHDHPVCDAVWKLYARAIELCGKTPTLLEWDADIPDLETVLAEAHKARRYLTPQPVETRHAG